MHWILQSGFHSEAGWDVLVRTLERFDINHSVHDVVPKTGDLVPEPRLTGTNVICIGSYSMRHVATRNGWKPGVFDLFSQDFKAQRVHWGEHMLNSRSVVCPLGRAAFTSERMFVRPTRDTKCFAGKVFTADEFQDWKQRLFGTGSVNDSSLTPETEVQISNVVSIEAEYRFWIVDGEIVTHSMYKRGRQVVYTEDVDERVTSFVHKRISEWLPHEAFVVDVCDCEFGIKIVELNTLNSSAFYAGDVQKLVLTLEDRFSP